MKLRAILHPAEEGGYWAEVPALPGCMTQGETREELVRNLREAVEGWLAAGDEKIPEGQQEIIEMAL
jgi:predicted RNase H-like HicB family nuclease